MTKFPIVSIIMPAYNVEKTIGRAIDSVISQTYSQIELIIVNDGSTDKTLDVIKGYKDSRINVISQPNGGLSCARNTGMKNATGDYLTFIDSDDWYEDTYIEKMISSSLINHSQLTVCGMILHKPNNILYSAVHELRCDSFWDNEAFLSLLESGIMNSTCNKIYELRIIKNNNLSFRNISIIEDLEFNMHYVELINCVCFIPFHLYHYDNTSSVLTKKVSSEMFDNYIHFHAWLLAKVPLTYFHIVSKFIFHQYYSFFIRYMNLVLTKGKKLRDIRKIFDFYLSNPLVSHSFEVYHSKVYGEKILKFLLWHRYYRILIIYMFLIQKKEQFDNYLTVKKSHE